MNKGLVWDWPFIIKISSFHPVCLWICWIWLSICSSRWYFPSAHPDSLCWCTFMLQFMTLSGFFVKHDKENDKSAVYIFSCTRWCARNIPVAELQCAAIKWRHVLLLGATCKAVQYTNMIYGTPPSPRRYPSISTAIITLNSIFLVLAAQIDVHNLFTSRQILNRKHQTTE